MTVQHKGRLAASFLATAVLAAAMLACPATQAWAAPPVAGVAALALSVTAEPSTASGSSSTPPASLPPAAAAATKIEPSSPKPDAAGQRRVREGSEVSGMSGTFRLTGDRVTFVASDGKLRFVVLENLALDRVTRALAEFSGSLPWTVSGSITEYRGVNFLLIRRAVVATGVEADGNP